MVAHVETPANLKDRRAADPIRKFGLERRNPPMRAAQMLDRVTLRTVA